MNALMVVRQTLIVLCALMLIMIGTGNALASYENDYIFDNTMIGPGQGDCSGYQQEAGGEIFPETGLVLGTYNIHQATLDGGFGEMRVQLDYDADPTTVMALYVFAPGDDPHDCDSAMTKIQGSSPLAILINPLPGDGIYHFRVQLDGLLVDGYHLHVTAE